ncbi:MAG: hypothetical protein QXX36_03705 [Candidatus Rehaiarchaeum fermentans]|nr:hypothetical protein [Candidatus Rehaiarchaeum fermentans]
MINMQALYIPVSPTSTSLPNTVHVLVQAPPNFPYSYQNMKFYHPNVGLVPSWYEGNGIWFVKVPAGVPLQSLYAVVYDNPVLDGQTVGVSPYVQLGYDNGQNVFNLYTNFQFDNPEIDKWNLVNAGFMLRDPNSGLPTSLKLNTTLIQNTGGNPNHSAIARNDGPTDYNQVVELSTSYWINTSNGPLNFYVGLWGYKLQYLAQSIINNTIYASSYSVSPVGGVEIQHGYGITVLYGSDVMASYTSGLIPQPNATVNLFFQAYFLQNSISAYYATSNSFFTSGVYNTNQLTSSLTYQSSSPLPNSGSIFVYGFGRYANDSWYSTDFSNTYWIRVRGVLPSGQTPIGTIQLS